MMKYSQGFIAICSALIFILLLTSTSTPMKGLEQKAWMKIQRMDSARSMWSV